MTTPDNAPAIAVIPYAERLAEGLANLPLDRLEWPLGRPARLARGTVADMRATDHLITYPKTKLYFAPRGRRKAQLSLMIVEPDAVHAKHLRLVRLFHRRFFRVLTKNAALLAGIPNGVKFVFGSTFLSDPVNVDTTKTRNASLIASSKRVWEGHLLRHAVVDRIRAENLPVDVMGRGYRPFADKAEGLAPYRYSVVIENLREPSYFTEKLVDTALCRTVPIYWGAPDIGDYFDTAGMVVCSGVDDIVSALRKASVADYEGRAAAIEENRRRALALYDTNGRAAAVIAAEVRA